MNFLKKILKDKANRDLIFLLLALILGAFFGAVFPNFIESLAWVGKIFMNTLMSLVIPLVFLALVSAITSNQNIQKLGKEGQYLFFIIIANVAFSALIGLCLAILFTPGLGVDAGLLLDHTDKNMFSTSHTLHFTDFIYGMFPANLAQVVVQSEILPLVIFGLFFSLVSLKISHIKEVKDALNICLGFKAIFMYMIELLLRLTPIALFSLIGHAVSSSILKGHFIQDIFGIFKFLILFFVGCFILSVSQFIVLRIFIGKNVYKFSKISMKSVLTGFATSSSMASLPVMLISAEEDKIDDSLAKFALPVTVVFNLGSSALYVTLSTLFVTQVLHYQLNFTNIVIIYVVSVVTGLGTTGIPNAGFIATMTVLKVLAIPSSAVAILFPIDSILSRIRTGVNVWGHLVCVKFIDAYLQKNKEL